MRSLGVAILAAASSRYSRNGMRAREEEDVVGEEEGDSNRFLVAVVVQYVTI